MCGSGMIVGNLFIWSAGLLVLIASFPRFPMNMHKDVSIEYFHVEIRFHHKN